ncbi:MAG: HAD family hydrolase [Burkholderiales bacterium]
MSIEWIVFDLGGVVVHTDTSRLFQLLARCCNNEPEDIQSALDGLVVFGTPMLPPLGDQYHLGLVDTERFLETICAALPCPATLDDVRDAWLSILTGENSETVAIMDKLAPRYPLACLSNTNALHWEYMAQRWPRI